jgi:hypothetical protein
MSTTTRCPADWQECNRFGAWDANAYRREGQFGPARRKSQYTFRTFSAQGASPTAPLVALAAHGTGAPQDIMFSRLLGRPPEFSIVVCSIDKTKFGRVSDNYRRLFRDRTIEIIGIHDARSLAEGYNRGIGRARGKYLILSHDDVRMLSPDFAARVQGHLERFDLIGIAGTTRLTGGGWFLAGYPYNFMIVTSPIGDPSLLCIFVQGEGPLVTPDIQALDGVFLATRTEVARAVGFDEQTFDHFHLYDLDFSFGAYLKSYRLAVCRDLFIVHESHGSFGDVWMKYRRRFEEKYADRLAPPPAEPDYSKVGNFVVSADILFDREAAARISRPESISRLIEETRQRVHMSDAERAAASAVPKHLANAVRDAVRAVTGDAGEAPERQKSGTMDR